MVSDLIAFRRVCDSHILDRMLSADRAKLFRLLALSNLPYDDEALAASGMANKLLKRTGASWAEFFAESAIGDIEPEPEAYRERATAETEAASGAYASSSARSPNFGTDIFRDKPACTPTISARIIRAGKLRLFLARIPWPMRLLLGPLTAAGYLSAWTIEGADTVVDAATRAMVAIVLSIAAALLWLECALVLTGHWPI
jgi:hypothetical protein